MIPVAVVALLVANTDASMQNAEEMAVPARQANEPSQPSQPATPDAVHEEPHRVEGPNYVVPIVHDLALLAVMRAAETVIWPNPFARPEQFGARYEEAFTHPPVFEPRRRFMEWDGDPWPVNTIGHGLFGSELYLRARMCRFPWYGSVAFAAGASALWEYGFEANGSRPSALDLVYTPLAGALLGEARFAIHRVAGGIESKTTRGIVRAIVDPLGEMERALGTDC
ncbi:Ubiquitin-protein ligase [Labilithrix luteola]|uniref:Ubiquitin-protein ligase n=1 Tax=Labilithrix luteola TaxID=1391654 RepID=A0A0K1PW36_9BACT|nr:DUF3943 domain-containing protein [Labilithrix luteola]AKU97730.1 Ubiquitin-protein ligase [Labilithrix luteola]